MMSQRLEDRERLVFLPLSRGPVNQMHICRARVRRRTNSTASGLTSRQGRREPWAGHEGILMTIVFAKEIHKLLF